MKDIQTTTAGGISGNHAQEDGNEMDVSPVTKSVVTLTICIIGLIGNLIVIFVITVLKEYRKSITHWYVLQLAIADSLFLLMVPFRVSENLENAWIFPEWLCKTQETIRYLNYYASILFLTIMSIDRYIAVCHTFSIRLGMFRKKKSAVIITISIWIVALLLCIPTMMYSFKIGTKPHCKCRTQFPSPPTSQTLLEDICKYEGSTGEAIQKCIEGLQKPPPVHEPYCIDNQIGGQQNYDEYNSMTTEASSGIGMPVEFNQTGLYNGYFNDFYYGDDSQKENQPNCNYEGSPSGWVTFIWFNFFVMFLAPFLVMAICYSLIIYRLSSSNVIPSRATSFSSQGKSGQPRKKMKLSTSNRDRARVTRMCAMLVISFLLCWILFHATHIAKIVGISNATNKFCEELAVAGSILIYLNSALNPYLYSFLNANFAQRFGKIYSNRQALVYDHRRASQASFKRSPLSSVNAFSVKLSKLRGNKIPSNSSTSVVTKSTRNATERLMLSSTEQVVTTECHGNQNRVELLSPVVNVPEDEIEHHSRKSQEDEV